MKFVNLDKNPNGVWTCEINRPEKHNALSAELISELTKTFEEANEAALKYKCRVFVLQSSSPKAFCVGADLAERKNMNDKEVVTALDSLRKLTITLENIACPTIAILEGAAFGGGLELALCCDLRVGSETAQMGLTETRLAIIPGAGGTQRLSRLVGISRAKELIFAAKRLNGIEARALGILNSCVADPKSWTADYIEQLLQAGPVALVAAKRAVNKGEDKTISAALDEERAAYLMTLPTYDRKEGLEAFVEKRKPRYKGV